MQVQPSASSEQSTAANPQAILDVPHAVLAEEVLMYHRASSRLIEMCHVM